MSSANIGWTVPLGEEDVAVIRVDHDCARTLQILQQRSSIGNITSAEYI